MVKSCWDDGDWIWIHELLFYLKVTLWGYNSYDAPPPESTLVWVSAHHVLCAADISTLIQGRGETGIIPTLLAMIVVWEMILSVVVCFVNVLRVGGWDVFYPCQVDKHIRKLDSDLARFESDLKEQHAKESGLSDFEAGVFRCTFFISDIFQVHYKQKSSASFRNPIIAPLTGIVVLQCWFRRIWEMYTYSRTSLFRSSKKIL